MFHDSRGNLWISVLSQWFSSLDWLRRKCTGNYLKKHCFLLFSVGPIFGLWARNCKCNGLEFGDDHWWFRGNSEEPIWENWCGHVLPCYCPLIARFLFALLDTMHLHRSFHRFLYVFSRLFSRNRSCRISHFHHRDHPPTKATFTFFTFANSLQALFNMQTTRLQLPMLDHPM